MLAKNFADDGVYRLTFYSEDAAGNIAENTLDTKKQEIGFGVDKTKPNMVVTNLESDTTYPLENLTVSLSAGDNLLLQSVVVYLDDYSKAYKTWTAEEIAAIVADQGEFTFDIPGDSTGAHQVKIVFPTPPATSRRRRSPTSTSPRICSCATTTISRCSSAPSPLW